MKYEPWITPEGLLLLEGWARDGISDRQIAYKCGCSPAALRDWKKRFPEIAKALKKGREMVDYEVENAVLKSALGYEYTETRVESGKEEKIVQTKKYMHPNVSAAKFWLQNRRPDCWGVRPVKKTDPEDPQTGCVILPEVDENG